MTTVLEWTPEQIATAIRDDIASYEQLKAKLNTVSREEARGIELQKFDKAMQIKDLKKELIEKGRADLWEEFSEWEKKIVVG